MPKSITANTVIIGANSRNYGTINANIITVAAGGLNLGTLNGDVTIEANGISNGTITGNVTVYGSLLGNTVTGAITVKSGGSNMANATGDITVESGGSNTGTANYTNAKSWSVTLSDQTSATIYTDGSVNALDGATVYAEQTLNTLYTSTTFTYNSVEYATNSSGVANSYVALTVTDATQGTIYAAVNFVAQVGAFVYSEPTLSEHFTGLLTYSGVKYFATSGELSTLSGAYSTGYYTYGVLDEGYNNATPQPVIDDSLWYTYSSGIATIANGNYSNYSFSSGEIDTNFTTVSGLLEFCYPVEAADNLGYYYEYSSGVASLASGLYVNAAYVGGETDITIDYIIPQKIKWTGGDAYCTYTTGIGTKASGAYTIGHYTDGLKDSTTTNAPSTPEMAQDTGGTTNVTATYYYYSNGDAVLATGAFSIGYLDANGQKDTNFSDSVPGNTTAQDDTGRYYTFAAGIADLATGLYKLGKYSNGEIDTNYNSQDGIPENSTEDTSLYQIYTAGVPAGGSTGKYPNYKLVSGAIDTTYTSPDANGTADYIGTPEVTELGLALYGNFIYVAGVASVPNAGAYSNGYYASSSTYGATLTTPSSTYAQALDTNSLWYEYAGDGNVVGIVSGGYYSFGYIVNGSGTSGANSIELSQDEVDTYRFYSSNNSYDKANGYYVQGYYSDGAQSVAPDEKPHQANDSVLFYTYSTTNFAAGSEASGFWTSGYYSNGAITSVAEGYYQADDNNYYFYNSDGTVGAQAPAAGTPAGTVDITSFGDASIEFVVGTESLFADGMGGTVTSNPPTYNYMPSGAGIMIIDATSHSNYMGVIYLGLSDQTTHAYYYGGNFRSDGAGSYYTDIDWPGATDLIVDDTAGVTITTPAGVVNYSISYYGDGNGGFSSTANYPAIGTVINSDTSASITTPAGTVNYTVNYFSDGNGGYTSETQWPAAGDEVNSEAQSFDVVDGSNAVLTTINYSIYYVSDGIGGYTTDDRSPVAGDLLYTGTDSTNGGGTITDIGGSGGGSYNYTIEYKSTGGTSYQAYPQYPNINDVIYTGTNSTNGGGTIHTSEISGSCYYDYSIQYYFVAYGQAPGVTPLYPQQGTILCSTANTVEILAYNGGVLTTYSYAVEAIANGNSESYTVSNNLGDYVYGAYLASDAFYNYYADGNGGYYTTPI